MSKLIVIILALVGLAGGVGAGLILRPAPSPAAKAVASAPGKKTASPAAAAPGGKTQAPTHEYTKLNNQFVVPVLKNGKVVSLVVLSLSLETIVGQKALIYQRAPKLRDAFLQALFNHANIGGFDGDFTANEKMDALRRALREIAIKLLGPRVIDVLILGIVRQDI